MRCILASPSWVIIQGFEEVGEIVRPFDLSIPPPEGSPYSVSAEWSVACAVACSSKLVPLEVVTQAGYDDAMADWRELSYAHTPTVSFRYAWGRKPS